MAKPHPFLTNHTQRIQAITHVVYEYGNLMVAGYYSIHGAAPWRTNCDDAFLLGCRKLDDFFMKDKRSVKGGQELDDILASDYLPPNTTRRWELPIWTSEWRDPMNKQLAHIAYSRGKGWDHTIWVPKLVDEFRKAWWDFYGAIIDADYIEEFDKQRKQRSGRIDLRKW